MFDFLKKKIGGFIDGLTKKEEKKIEAPVPETKTPELGISKPEAKKVPETKPPITKPGIPKAPTPEPKIEIPKAQKPIEVQKPITKPEAKKAPEPKHAIPTSEPKIETPKQQPRREIAKAPEPKHEPKPEIPEQIETPKQQPKPETPKRETKLGGGVVEAERGTLVGGVVEAERGTRVTEVVETKRETRVKEVGGAGVVFAGPEEEKPKERIKLGILGAVKSMITREVEISEGDVKDMLDGLELELLEADVDMGVAEGITQELRAKLIGSRVPKANLHSFVAGIIKDTLVDVLTNEKAFDIVERVDASEKPVKIMFIGINGAGKTTTIAKVARLLMDNKKKVVFAAADTFRAAAIEQMSVHADRLGVKVIKRDYGSDPTSVAYDAVNYAKAHGMDAVLIDTAGRQDTNISLINEMKKMRRVINPDLTVYIGESIAGNALLEQVASFNREVGVDAVILTKMDCDPKGGTMLSLSRATGIPIIYVGMGQGYGDLERFDPQAIAARIVE